jgi:hypothetical protein
MSRHQAQKEDIASVNSDTVLLPKVGTPTLDTLTEDFTTRGSSGVADGTLTYVTVGSTAVKISVAAGEGYIRTSNDQQAPLVFCKWSISTDLYTFSAPAAGQENVIFIGIEYSAGVAAPVAKTAFSDWNWYTNFPLARASYDGTTMRILNAYAHAEDTANLTRKWMRLNFPFHREEAPEGSGGLELSVSLRALAMTAGKIWHGYNNYSLSALASGVAFDTHYRRAGGGFNKTTGVTSFPNTQYDDGSGTLVTMSGASKLAVLWVYLDVSDGSLDVMYGRGEYNSVALAQAEGIPTTPTHLTYHGKLIGRIIFQKSGASPTLVESAWQGTFNASVVGDHSLLTNLQGGAAGEYYHLTSAQNTVVGNTSGTNSGNETATTIGALIGGATDATPNDTDFVATSLTAAGILKKITWTNVKVFLKTYFDTLYAVTAKGVTNGDSHDHNGGDGAQIAYSTLGNAGLPSGIVVNYRIVPSVASNNLTLALKGLDGNDASASNPIKVRIGNTERTITAALSVTKNAGTGWMALDARFAAKECDFFAYLGYNATDGVVLGFSRYPGANLYGDFSTTTTNEKYCAISTITNAAAGDDYVVIGRFAATLSATPNFNWSVPTFTSSNLIQRPIFNTRWLTWLPSYSALAPMSYSDTAVGNYMINYQTIFLSLFTFGTTSGTASAQIFFTPPWTTALAAFNIAVGGATADGAGVTLGGFATNNTTTSFRIARYDGGNFGIGTSRGGLYNPVYSI